MHLHSTFLTALLVRLVLGQSRGGFTDAPICNNIAGEGLVNFGNIDCSSTTSATENCNNMCFSQTQGCGWGRKSSVLEYKIE